MHAGTVVYKTRIEVSLGLNLLLRDEGEMSVVFEPAAIEKLKWILQRALNTAEPSEHKELFLLDAYLNNLALPTAGE